MGNIACVTGADRGLGFSLSEGLLRRGWWVIAGQFMPDWPDLKALYEQYPDKLYIVSLDVSRDDSVNHAAKVASGFVEHLDVLISNAGISSRTMRATIREPQDYDGMHRLYDVNTLGALRIVRAFLPLLDLGKMRRLCFVSSEAGSIDRCVRETGFGYTMSKAALNMAVKTLFNHLRPEGYTFRLLHPGWLRTYMGGVKSTRGDMEPDEAAGYALSYFLDELPADPNEPDADPEDQLVLRDWLRRDWPW